MNIWNLIFLSFIGLSCGLIVSGGMFTVLLTVGLMPRFAGKTHTAKHVKLYESATILGTIFFCLMQLFEWEIPLTQIFLGFFGLFSGIFVGSLAVAIAEMLDGIPIFARRIQFRRGLGIALLCLAIGKSFGSFIYFAVMGM